MQGTRGRMTRRGTQTGRICQQDAGRMGLCGRELCPRTRRRRGAGDPHPARHFRNEPDGRPGRREAVEAEGQIRILLLPGTGRRCHPGSRTRRGNLQRPRGQPVGRCTWPGASISKTGRHLEAQAAFERYLQGVRRDRAHGIQRLGRCGRRVGRTGRFRGRGGQIPGVRR